MMVLLGQQESLQSPGEGTGCCSVLGKDEPEQY